MKISDLQRKSEAEIWHIKARKSIAKPRGDMVTILRYLDEESGESNIRGLQKHLCLRRVMAERLLEYACLIGLVSKNGKGKTYLYKLTDEGREALKKKKVFIPEDGIWEMTLCKDSLLPHPVVSLKDYKESHAWDEIKSASKEKTEKRQELFEDVPSWIKQIENFRGFIPHENGEEMMVESICRIGEKVKSEKSLNIRWDVHKKQVHLESKGKDLDPFPGPKSIDSDIIWKEFLKAGDKLEHWNKSRKSLAVSFKEVKDSERNSMKKTFKYKKPEISGYGKFDDITIEGVRIHAKTEGDARKWALWRLNQKIVSLANREEYAKWLAEASGPFSEYHLELPKRDAYAEEIWQSSKNFEERKKAWYMIAAVDWNL